MNFPQAISNAISIYHTIFEGRAPRSAYWWPVLPMFAGYVLMFALMAAAIPFAEADGEFAPGAAGPITLLVVVYLVVIVYSMVMTVPILVLTGRRLHDTDRSAWWILISLVPLVGPIILLVFMVLRGTDGPNRFGDDPLDPGAGGGGYGGSGLTSSSIPSVPRE